MLRIRSLSKMVMNIKSDIGILMNINGFVININLDGLQYIHVQRSRSSGIATMTDTNDVHWSCSNSQKSM